MINDFNLENKPSTKVLKKYEDFLPEEIITLWKDNGFGTFMNGYFKIVNSENYQDILQTTSRRYKDGVVLLITAMGDLIIWADGYVRILKYRFGRLSTLMPNFKFFFSSLESNKFKDNYLKWQPYPEAVQKYGEPAYEECFGYVPLLGLGGPEKVENLQKAKLKEHILLISEFMGPIE